MSENSSSGLQMSYGVATSSSLDGLAEIALLPEELKERIWSLGGADLRLVMEKGLFQADVDPREGRLSMPGRESSLDGYLSKTEREALAVRDMSTKRQGLVGMKVKVIDPALRVMELTLKQWSYSGTASSYMLTKGWNDVVAGNDLKKGDKVQIWAFRIQQQLAFTLLKLPVQEPKLPMQEFMWGAKRKRGTLPTPHV